MTAAAVTAAGLSNALRQVWLPLWFVLIDLSVRVPQLLNGSVPVGADARIYLRAASMYLAGQDPWSAAVTIHGFVYHFAGLPTDVLVYAPLTLLPEETSSLMLVVLAGLSAIWVIRRLELPGWYLLFPPIVEGIYDGNPQLPLLALLLIGLGPIAALLKIYAVVPMLGERRWGALGITFALLGGCFLIAPNLWLSYADQFGAISNRLVSEAGGGYSAWGQDPVLLIGTIGAVTIVALRSTRTAGWLAVPAVWPASEFHYGVLALPVITPAAAAALAFPLRGAPAFVAIGYAGASVARWIMARRRTAPSGEVGSREG